MTPPKRGVALFCVLFWGLSFLLSFGINFGAVVINGLVFGLAVWYFLSKGPKYSVCLGSASGETAVLTAKDRNYIEEITSRVSDAITAD